MRSKIFMYMFIFMLMLTIFIYVNDKKILEAKQNTIELLDAKVKGLQTENDSLLSKNLDLNYFSLDQNEEAITYFEDRGIDAKELSQKVEDAIISRNRAEDDNELIPFAGMEGVMRINKVKILNHKWIIVDFTDGTYWGELLLSYDLDENNNLILNTEKSFLYPQD